MVLGDVAGAREAVRHHVQLKLVLYQRLHAGEAVGERNVHGDPVVDDAIGRGIAAALQRLDVARRDRSEEHTSELQSLMRISYAVFCLKKKIQITNDQKKQTKIYEIEGP